MRQDEVLRYAIEVLERLEIPYMVVGSLASGAYGDPRFTQDIDIVVDLSDSQVGLLCTAFPTDQFYVSLEAAMQAAKVPGSQFNVIHPESGNKIDFMIARQDAWGREQISRRWQIRLLPDRQAYAARAEDIILSKMLYYEEGGSDKHLRDIAGMLKLSGHLVDREYVLRWASQLGVEHVWAAILQKAAAYFKP